MPDFFDQIKNSKTPPSFKYFCDGEWLTSKSGKQLEIFSPVTDEILGRIQSLTK